MISRREKRKIKSFLVLIFLGFICLYFLTHYFLYKGTKRQTTISPIASYSPSVSPKAISLGKAVEGALEGTKGTYSVAIKNLKNGETYYLKEHQVFDAGSLYKLWIMVVAYEQIQKGDLSEDEVLSEDVADLNNMFNISEDTAELTDGKVTLSVNDALNQMITISHNYAAFLLTKRIKLSNISLFLKNNGFSESKVGIGEDSPATTAWDITQFFEKLYKGELANKESTDKMLTLLKKQQLNDKLPKYLPENTQVAHKTGEIDYFSHDGGIVFSPSGDYIITVLSKSDIPQAAEDRISQISKEVYDFYLKGGENK